MIVGFGNQPGRIGSGVKKISSVYAGDTIEDPCCGDVICASEKSPAILVDGTATLGDCAFKFQRVTT
jgi:hypothetical protein